MVESSSVMAVDTLWVLVSAFLVFLLVGFGIMFGGDALASYWTGNIPTWVFFLFQAMFAATAATIVSGAVAGRTKFGSYVIFSLLLTGLIYPIAGHWIWGGGFLAERGFMDFAGSTAVHSVGGWAALAGIIVVGSRMGRFQKGFDQKRFDGHSIPLAALGAFILWFGWFGFNGGSMLGISNSEVEVGKIIVNTQLGASAGVVFAVVLGWMFTKKVKAGFALNGALGGLVAITAGCNVFTPVMAILVGAIGGVVVVAVEKALEAAKLDDAVGAVPVHLGAGVWGTLAIGLFAVEGGLFYGGGWSLLGTQALGVVAVGALVFIVSLVLFKLLAAIVGLRASKAEEESGLDSKHGQAAYMTMD